jgi:hypothetical protein
MARIVALLVLAVLAAPASGLAAAAATNPAQSPLQQTTPASPQNQIGEQPTQTQAQQTSTGGGSISGWDGLLIGAGIVALIGAIWFVIARDAKRATAGRLPAADGAPGGGSATRASRRSRRLSAAERKRRKRGRAH